MRISIKFKGVLFLAILLFLALGTSGYLVLQGIEQNQQKEYEEQLLQQAQTANLYIRQDYAKISGTKLQDYLRERGYQLARQIGLLTNTQVVLYDRSGAEIGNSSPGLQTYDVGDTLQYAITGKTAYQKSGGAIYHISPITIAGNQVGAVQLYYSLEEANRFYAAIQRLFISIGSIVFLIAFVFGYLYFGRMAAVIHQLMAAADNVKQGKYKEIPELRRNDELGALRQGIYYMSSQIERNILEMKEEQHKLMLAVEKLKTLEQQQKQFIGSVTHELKTPLTVMKAYTDLLEMYPEDEKLMQEARESLARETQRLYDMVDKTLQLAALEKYEFELDFQAIAIEKLLAEVCSRLEGKLQKQGIVLKQELQPVMVYADRESLLQAFMNLLDNAIKYNNPKGQILVRSYSSADAAYLEIQDTGIGIPENLKAKIFEPFYTVDKARARQHGGFGLGLALVKQLIERQKGEITLVSAEGKGTTFTIKLPLVK